LGEVVGEGAVAEGRPVGLHNLTVSDPQVQHFQKARTVEEISRKLAEFLRAAHDAISLLRMNFFAIAFRLK
jgi:hypothetical protein